MAGCYEYGTEHLSLMKDRNLLTCRMIMNSSGTSLIYNIKFMYTQYAGIPNWTEKFANTFRLLF
jgi:hypothetical protein